MTVESCHDVAAARADTVLDGRVALRQPAEGYRVAVDPVLLAAAVEAKPGARVLDLGCGVGGAALCLLARTAGTQAAGLEVQPTLAALAQGNARGNGLQDRFQVAVGDVMRPPFDARPGFDHVICNPPYQRAAEGRPPTSPIARTANMEGAAKLADWIACGLAQLRPKGTFTLIHRADRLDEILMHLHGRVGDIALRLIHPRVDRDAKRVIVRARPGVATPMRVCPALVLHNADGSFTDRAQAILRGAAALGW